MAELTVNAPAESSHHSFGSLCLNQGQEATTPDTPVRIAYWQYRAAKSEEEVQSCIHTLACALGAKRMEVGSARALRAVLSQLAYPEMSDKAAWSNAGASKSTFLVWRRRVHDRLFVNFEKGIRTTKSINSRENTHRDKYAAIKEILEVSMQEELDGSAGANAGESKRSAMDLDANPFLNCDWIDDAFKQMEPHGLSNPGHLEASTGYPHRTAPVIYL